MVTLDFIRNFQLFLLVMVRMFGMFVVAPFFASLIIPARARAILAFFTTIVVFPVVAHLQQPVSLELVPYLFQLGGEVLIGIVFGFLIAIFFSAFQFAGQLFSFQMGLGISMVFDPQAQVQLPIVGQMLSLFAILVFLSINAHHHLINGVYQSYRTIPVLNIVGQAPLFAKGVGEAFMRMFGAAILIGLPMIATAFLISVTLGILAKTAPQLNVLMMGFPIQIAVGFSVLILAVPLMFRFMANFIGMGIKFTIKLFAGP